MQDVGKIKAGVKGEVILLEEGRSNILEAVPKRAAEETMEEGGTGSTVPSLSLRNVSSSKTEALSWASKERMRCTRRCKKAAALERTRGLEERAGSIARGFVMRVW